MRDLDFSTLVMLFAVVLAFALAFYFIAIGGLR
jgi:hypothetical protein